MIAIIETITTLVSKILDVTIIKNKSLKENKIAKKKAENFIRSHSKELNYLPLCIMAKLDNPSYKYHKKIYNEFNTLDASVQREVLNQENLNIDFKYKGNLCQNFLNEIIKFIEKKIMVILADFFMTMENFSSIARLVIHILQLMNLR